jgi:hypothetical protein
MLRRYAEIATPAADARALMRCARDTRLVS